MATTAVAPVDVRRITEDYHKLAYGQNVTWFGHETQKYPPDLMMYQEILWENRPDLLIECGTWRGGSALFFANMFDILHWGTVLTIDVNQWPGFPIHQRIMYLTGSTVDEKVMKQVSEIAGSFRNVMVVLDSDHSREHVLQELDLYAPLVSPGQYMVVEDTNVHGHPVREDHPPGPWEAVEEWLPRHDEFYRDKMCERFLVTMHPGGWLRKVKS